MKQELVYDWKDINIEGGTVTHTFGLKNTGTDDLILKGGNTSCMCTTGQIEFKDGTSSSIFGMHNPSIGQWARSIKPGESFQMKVVFDPMAHGPAGTGPILREVNLVTSAPIDGKLSQSVGMEAPVTGSVTTFRLMGDVLPKDKYMEKYPSGTPTSMMENEDEEGMMNNDKGEYVNMKEYETTGEDLSDKTQKKENRVIIDTRDDAERSETGMIQGSIGIPLNKLSLDALEQNGISKDSNIIVYGHSGEKGHQAYERLNALGFQNVKSLFGGSVHWMEDKMPMVPWENKTTSEDPVPSVSLASAPHISFDRPEQDLGMVSSTEKTKTTFTVSNTGTEDLKISLITTSCGCTSAEIGSKIIAPGQSTTLTVQFDPTVHQEPKDKFKRTVFLETNDPSKPEAEVNIWVDIDEGK